MLKNKQHAGEDILQFLRNIVDNGSEPESDDVDRIFSLCDPLLQEQYKEQPKIEYNEEEL